MYWEVQFEQNITTTVCLSKWHQFYVELEFNDNMFVSGLSLDNRYYYEYVSSLSLDNRYYYEYVSSLSLDNRYYYE